MKNIMPFEQRGDHVTISLLAAEKDLQQFLDQATEYDIDTRDLQAILSALQTHRRQFTAFVRRLKPTYHLDEGAR